MPQQLHQSSKEEDEFTTGKTLHRARLYDLLGAILTLGRGSAMRGRTIELAHLAPGERVLEVGCGTGEIAMRAKARTGRTGSVAGIDPSAEMIAVARQKAARANLDIDYRVASVEALPFADATFDVVLSSLMMHHLPEDLKSRALAEIRRVLKPGGRLLIVDLTEPTSRLARLQPVWLIHRQLPSDVRDLPELLEAAGFAAVEAGPTGFGYLGFVQGQVDKSPPRLS